MGGALPAQAGEEPPPYEERHLLRQERRTRRRERSRRHIAQGQAGSATSCAIAVALCEKPDILAARIERSVAFVEYEDRIVKYVLGNQARHSIIQFDMAGGRFAPTGPVKLLAVNWSRKQATRKERDKIPARRPQGAVPQRSIRTDPLTLAGVRYGTGQSITIES